MTGQHTCWSCIHLFWMILFWFAFDQFGLCTCTMLRQCRLCCMLWMHKWERPGNQQVIEGWWYVQYSPMICSGSLFFCSLRLAHGTPGPYFPNCVSPNNSVPVAEDGSTLWLINTVLEVSGYEYLVLTTKSANVRDMHVTHVQTHTHTHRELRNIFVKMRNDMYCAFELI